MKRIIIIMCTVSAFIVAQDAAGQYKLSGVDVLYTYITRAENTLTVTDAYGATATSEIVVGVEAEQNEHPMSDAGANQEWYMPDGIDERTTTIDDNSGADSDNDALSFSWSSGGFDSSGDSAGGWLTLVQDLGVGDHTFTFTVTDSYGASASDDVTISIYDEPASAAVTNVATAHGLYYVEITFNEGVLDAIENYEGALKDYIKAIKIDEESVGGPGFGTVILNYKFKSSSVKERAIYIHEQLQLPENERILKIKELDEGQVMHKPGKL